MASTDTFIIIIIIIIIIKFSSGTHPSSYTFPMFTDGWI
jgi:hypothetical protein